MENKGWFFLIKWRIISFLAPQVQLLLFQSAASKQHTQACNTHPARQEDTDPRGDLCIEVILYFLGMGLGHMYIHPASKL